MFVPAPTTPDVSKPINLAFYGVGYQTFYACGYYVVLKLHYSAKPFDYSVFCRTPAAIATIVGCYVDGNRDTAAYTEFWRDQCATLYHSPITHENITEAYKHLIKDGVALANLGNYTAGQLNVPVIIPQEDVQAAMATYEMLLGNYNNSMFYGVGALVYWGLIFLVSGMANWSLVILPGLHRSLDGTLCRLWRKYVTLPALVRKKKIANQTFFFKIVSCIVPSRLESFVICMFFWLLFVFSLINIHTVKNDTVFALHVIAMNRYVANRTGILCIFLVPLLILFAGRNNFLMWVSRWKFATFITFHRWIARIMVLLAFIHGVCALVMFSLMNELNQKASRTCAIWGIVGLFCAVVMCFQSLLYLRRRWYEVFLVFHVILAVFFMIGIWYHIKEFGYAQFFYASIAVWGIDRAIRLFRVLFFGFPKADVSVFSDDTLKVEIPKPARWKAKPGGHAFVYFMHLYYFWQSHPFTYNELDTHVTFFCKVKTGVTKSLYEHLNTLESKNCQMRVSVEGPYGQSHPVKYHSDVVFLAGGNGIPGLFSEFEHLNKANDGKQKLKIRWIIREIKSFAWMSQEFRRFAHSNSEITVHVTRPNFTGGSDELFSTSSCDVSSSKDKSDQESCENPVLSKVRNKFPYIIFKEGRPKMKEIVEKDIDEADHSVAFIVCGSSVMVDEVRYQVVDHIDKTKKRIDFHEAQETWA